MADTKVDRLDRVLTELITASSGIDAAAVVSFDGLMIASALPDGLDEDRVGAMSAALLSLGEQAIEGFGCGHLDQLFAEGDEGFVVMMSARDEAVLTAVADRHAKVGFILYEMRKAAQAVADIMVQTVTGPAAGDRDPRSDQSTQSHGLLGHTALPPRPLFTDDRRTLPVNGDAASAPTPTPALVTDHGLPINVDMPTRPRPRPADLQPAVNGSQPAAPGGRVNGEHNGRTSPPAAWQ